MPISIKTAASWPMLTWTTRANDPQWMFVQGVHIKTIAFALLQYIEDTSTDRVVLCKYYCR